MMCDGRILARKVHLQGGINFRDLGGCRMADGRTLKKGLLFRSGALDELTPSDVKTLAALPVTHVLDYRDEAEAQRRPDQLWQDVSYECVPANISSNGSVSSTWLKLLLSHATDGTRAITFMKGLYQQLPFNNPAYRRLLALLRTPKTLRLLQHCAIGKDRTGVGSAITLLTLGASRQMVIEDYMLTQAALAPHRERWLATVDRQQMGTKYEAMFCAMSAHEEFIGATLDAIESYYGGVAGYLHEEYGLVAADRAALQARYLE